jgi:hypothetical protein
LGAVEFDDELERHAGEVYDVCADRGLPAELVASELLRAEKVPETFFGRCGFVAERAREVALSLVSVHVRWFTPSLALPARGRGPDISKDVAKRR